MSDNSLGDLEKGSDSSQEKKKIEDNDRNAEKKRNKNIDAELQATVASITKMKQKLVSQEKKFKKWESNLRQEIPQQIDEMLKKRIAIEIEKKLIELEVQESRHRDSKSEEIGGTKRKIRKIIQIEDEDERNMVQKIIDERVREEREKKANEEEIKRKYKHLIQAEVKKALIEQCDADSSSSNEGQLALENIKPGSYNRVLKQRQYNHNLNRRRPSNSNGPIYSQDEGYDGYVAVSHPTTYDRF